MLYSNQSSGSSCPALVHTQENRTKFERNSSQEYYQITSIEKTKYTS